MKSKGTITTAIVAAGKSAAEGTKALAGKVANAAATASAASAAAAGVVLDKVATAIEAKKPLITSVQETVVAAGKIAAEEAKVFAGEVADAAAAAAATARAASTTVVGAVLGKVATAIEVRKYSSRAKKKVAKRVAAKKRAAPKKNANTKKASHKTAKNKRS